MGSRSQGEELEEKEGGGREGARPEDLGWATPGTYMPKRVQVVVGELEFLEGDELPHPMRPCGWRVRVHVQTARHGWLRFPRHGPRPRRGGTPSLSARSAAGSHAWPGLLKVRMIWKWPDPQVSLARRWYQASFPPQLFFLPPHPSPQHQGRPRGLAAPRCPPSGRFWEPRCAKKVSEKSLRAFEGGFVFKSWQLWERPTQGTGLSSPLLPVLLKYHGPILQFHKKAGSKRVTHKK